MPVMTRAEKPNELLLKIHLTLAPLKNQAVRLDG
jgi:hypothetical protein